MRIAEILEWRDRFAEIVAEMARTGCQWEIVGAFDCTKDRDYILSAIEQAEGLEFDYLRKAFGGYARAVVLAAYRPDNPEPNALDLLDLGRITFDRTIRLKDPDDAWTVNLIDYIIVDKDGSWKSVLEATGLAEITLCPHCGMRVFERYDTATPMVAPAPNDGAWDDLERLHAEGCPWVKTRGRIEQHGNVVTVPKAPRRARKAA